jgi:hypothetical protein
MQSKILCTVLLLLGSFLFIDLGLLLFSLFGCLQLFGWLSSLFVRHALQLGQVGKFRVALKDEVYEHGTLFVDEAVGREIDGLLMGPDKLVKDEICIKLNAHHRIGPALIDVLDHHQKVVPQNNSLVT